MPKGNRVCFSGCRALAGELKSYLEERESRGQAPRSLLFEAVKRPSGSPFCGTKGVKPSFKDRL
jgi:hypothetical protein